MDAVDVDVDADADADADAAALAILAFWNSSFFNRKYASSNVSLLCFLMAMLPLPLALALPFPLSPPQSTSPSPSPSPSQAPSPSPSISMSLSSTCSTLTWSVDEDAAVEVVIVVLVRDDRRDVSLRKPLIMIYLNLSDLSLDLIIVFDDDYLLDLLLLTVSFIPFVHGYLFMDIYSFMDMIVDHCRSHRLWCCCLMWFGRSFSFHLRGRGGLFVCVVVVYLIFVTDGYICTVSPIVRFLK